MSQNSAEHDVRTTKGNRNWICLSFSGAIFVLDVKNNKEFVKRVCSGLIVQEGRWIDDMYAYVSYMLSFLFEMEMASQGSSQGVLVRGAGAGGRRWRVGVLVRRSDLGGWARCSAPDCERRLQDGALPSLDGLCPLCSAIERLRRAALRVDGESNIDRRIIHTK